MINLKAFLIRISLVASLFSVVTTTSSFATSLTALLAPNLAPKLSSPTVGPGTEKTLRLSRFIELGGSYDPLFLAYSHGAFGSLRFYSLVSHIRIPGLFGVRLDAKAGALQRTMDNVSDLNNFTKSSGFAPAAEMGLSYPVTFGKSVSLAPHVGVRDVHNGPSGQVEPGPAGMKTEFGSFITIKL